MPCCGAEPAGAPAILTQRAARGESGRLWRRSSRACRRRLMSGKLSLPSGMVFSQEAERRGLARLAANAANLFSTKTHLTSILTKTIGVLLGKRCSVMCRVGFTLEERCSSTIERGY